MDDAYKLPLDFHIFKDFQFFSGYYENDPWFQFPSESRSCYCSGCQRNASSRWRSAAGAVAWYAKFTGGAAANNDLIPNCLAICSQICGTFTGMGSSLPKLNEPRSAVFNFRVFAFEGWDGTQPPDLQGGRFPKMEACLGGK